MNLFQFIADMHKSLIDFERWYMEKYREDPEDYPLEITKDNDGLWLEFFLDHINKE